MQLSQQGMWIKLDKTGSALAIFQLADAQQAAKAGHERVGFANRLFEGISLR
ncbi:hypothetical protein D3C79_649490 [compost metagenome]